VIIPTYNRCLVLAHTIESILRQTLEDWELIVIDDGSTDETQETTKKYVSPKIRLVRTPHVGSPRAWNRGVAEANFDYLFFTGDDTMLSPNCLEILAKKMEEMKDLKIGAIAPRLVYTKNFNLIDDPVGGKKYLHVDKFTGNVGGSSNASFQGTTEVETLHGYSLVHKKAFLEVGGFDTANYTGNYYREETDLWLRMKQKGYRLFYQPDAKIYALKGVTFGGQWSNVKGSHVKYEYYVLRNHYAFLKKFYPSRRLVMFTLFAIQRILSGTWNA